MDRDHGTSCGRLRRRGDQCCGRGRDTHHLSRPDSLRGPSCRGQRHQHPLAGFRDLGESLRIPLTPCGGAFLVLHLHSRERAGRMARQHPADTGKRAVILPVGAVPGPLCNNPVHDPGSGEKDGCPQGVVARGASLRTPAPCGRTGFPVPCLRLRGLFRCGNRDPDASLARLSGIQQYPSDEHAQERAGRSHQCGGRSLVHLQRTDRLAPDGDHDHRGRGRLLPRGDLFPEASAGRRPSPDHYDRSRDHRRDVLETPLVTPVRNTPASQDSLHNPRSRMKDFGFSA